MLIVKQPVGMSIKIFAVIIMYVHPLSYLPVSLILCVSIVEILNLFMELMENLVALCSVSSVKFRSNHVLV